jgi:hypothetical protein
VITYNDRMTRGQTKVITLRVRDSTGQPVDLTDILIYFAMRADIKILPSVQLTNDTDQTSPWRQGIVIADQTQSRGQFAITLIPADTVGLVAMGDDDPWIYDVWIVDSSENGLGTMPVVDRSTMGLYPQVTIVPA